MSRKILVVDDDEFLRELLQLTLEVEGYEVSVAAEGAEAVRRIEAERFDLVVLDLMMPVLDGLRLLQRVPEDGRPPTIVLSASSTPEIIAQAQGLGAHAVLRKPVDRKQFMSVVHSILAPKASEQA